MIRVALMYDRVRWEEKALMEVAKDCGIEIIPVNVKNKIFKMNTDSWSDLQVDAALQRCISYFRGLHITAILEFFSVPTINSFHVSLTCGNKLFTTLALMRAGVPTPTTYIAFSAESALKALEELGYPSIFKPIIGSWGRMVSPLIENMSAKALFEILNEMGPLYKIFYLQEMVNKPQRDIRTFVIGDEVVAAIYRYAKPGEWRTNTARGGRAVKCPINDDLIELSLKAAEAVGGGVLGVDIMESEKGLLVHEVNSTIEFKNTVPVTGVDIPRLIMKYVKKIVKG